MLDTLELVVVAFSEEGKADEVLKKLQKLSSERVIKIVDAAVLVRQQDGKSYFKETADVDAPHGALFGAVSGALIGLMAGAVGSLVGAVAGAATGGVAAHNTDMGIPDDYLQELTENLSPGSSAVVAIIEHIWIDKVIAKLDQFGGEILRQKIKADIAD
jgi:uncharacterized membrane protein